MADSSTAAMIAATKALVVELHAKVVQLSMRARDLADRVRDVDAKAQATKERVDADTIRVRDNMASLQAVTDENGALWKALKAQDERIADLEALEGYGWRAPPVYEMGRRS